MTEKEFSVSDIVNVPFISLSTLANIGKTED